MHARTHTHILTRRLQLQLQLAAASVCTAAANFWRLSTESDCDERSLIFCFFFPPLFFPPLAPPAPPLSQPRLLISTQGQEDVQHVAAKHIPDSTECHRCVRSHGFLMAGFGFDQRSKFLFVSCLKVFRYGMASGLWVQSLILDI